MQFECLIDSVDLRRMTNIILETYNTLFDRERESVWNDDKCKTAVSICLHNGVHRLEQSFAEVFVSLIELTVKKKKKTEWMSSSFPMQSSMRRKTKFFSAMFRSIVVVVTLTELNAVSVTVRRRRRLSSVNWNKDQLNDSDNGVGWFCLTHVSDGVKIRRTDGQLKQKKEESCRRRLQLT